MPKSEKERDSIWAIHGEVEWIVADAFNFDVSLKSADVGRYVEELSRRICGGAREACMHYRGG